MGTCNASKTIQRSPRLPVKAIQKMTITTKLVSLKRRMLTKLGRDMDCSKIQDTKVVTATYVSLKDETTIAATLVIHK